MHSAPKELTENVTILGNYFYNQYLVRGRDKSALIEAGVSATVDQAIAHLKTLGVAPDYIVVTHPHADHYTGLEALREAFPNATVVATEAANKFMSHPKAIEAMVREDEHMHSIMREKGFSTDRAPVTAPPSLEGAMWVGEGDTIDLGGVELKFMEATGHSPGHVVVHVPQDDVLIVSDSLGFRYPGRRYMPMFFTNRDQYLDSLERFAAIGAEVLGLGHQGAITGRQNVAKAFDEAVEATHKFVDMALDNTADDDKLEGELFEDLYKEELVINSPDNIHMCLHLLFRRSREQAGA